MAGQYSESSRLSFPWSLFGGCFNHLFVARRLPRWVLVFAMDSTRFEVLETILKRSSNDLQMPAYWFLQWILQVLTCSQRSSNGPQTILKCPCIGFCNGFYKFWGSQIQTILKRPRIGFCNGFYKFWGSQNDPQTNLKRSSNARVLVFAMDSTSFEVLRTILKKTSNKPQTILKRWRTGFCNGFYKFWQVLKFRDLGLIKF